jgi:signal transduction histidine kinase
MMGMAIDVTQRKLAEEALSRLSGELINAQEDERRRIAREIHDDFQQRLAVLTIELESLSQDLGVKDTITLIRLRDLSSQVSALGADLHSLSHRLHSSALESMGLVAALKGLCAESGRHHDLKVSFVAENVPEKIPNDTSLCLFRITQEALQNARKHSRAQTAQVCMRGTEGTIHLSVSDQGTGFDPEESGRNRGIGIRSMEERARLVGGRLDVRSRQGAGTIVQVWVPVSVSEASLQTVGNTLESA